MKTYNIDGATLIRARLIRETQDNLALLKRERFSVSEFLAWLLFNSIVVFALLAACI